jgi:hypothetical protein
LDKGKLFSKKEKTTLGKNDFLCTFLLCYRRQRMLQQHGLFPSLSTFNIKGAEIKRNERNDKRGISCCIAAVSLALFCQLDGIIENYFV